MTATDNFTIQQSTNSGGDLLPDRDSGSLIQFLHHRRIGQFWRFISIFHTATVHRTLFMKVSEMTDADKSINSLHFGSDLADTCKNLDLDQSKNLDSNPRSFLIWGFDKINNWHWQLGRGMLSQSASCTAKWIVQICWGKYSKTPYLQTPILPNKTTMTSTRNTETVIVSNSKTGVLSSRLIRRSRRHSQWRGRRLTLWLRRFLSNNDHYKLRHPGNEPHVFNAIAPSHLAPYKLPMANPQPLNHKVPMHPDIRTTRH